MHNRFPALVEARNIVPLPSRTNFPMHTYISAQVGARRAQDPTHQYLQFITFTTNTVGARYIVPLPCHMNFPIYKPHPPTSLSFIHTHPHSRRGATTLRPYLCRIDFPMDNSLSFPSARQPFCQSNTHSLCHTCFSKRDRSLPCHPIFQNAQPPTPLYWHGAPCPTPNQPAPLFITMMRPIASLNILPDR